MIIELKPLIASGWKLTHAEGGKVKRGVAAHFINPETEENK